VISRVLFLNFLPRVMNPMYVKIDTAIIIIVLAVRRGVMLWRIWFAEDKSSANGASFIAVYAPVKSPIANPTIIETPAVFSGFISLLGRSGL